MSDTPFFPAWRGRFHRAAAVLERLQRCTLDQLEARLGPFLPGLPVLTAAAASARERPYSVRRTCWSFLWQKLQPDGSCRQVVRQLQAVLALEGQRIVDSGTSAYCQARARLPLPLLRTVLQVSAEAAERTALPSDTLQGRPVKTMDGTTLTLPDTPANQAQYPQPTTQQPGCGFPLLHLLLVQNAQGGGIQDYVIGDRHHGEMRLLHTAMARLSPKDIVVYDSAAGNYVACALLPTYAADLISRVAIRKIDWREGQRLGPNERLVTWKKGRQPVYLSAEEWARLPATILVRVIRVRVQQRGFRVRFLSLVTTLVDPVAYPAAEIAAAYLRRWRLEMSLDDLKTTLGADALRCHSPALIERELLACLIVHNLVRAVMAEAAAEHDVPLERISFKGTLDALRSFCAASTQALSARRRRTLWATLLFALADDLLPLRPDRWEPRLVKRRPKSYPPLSRPRHQVRQRRHGAFFRRPKNT